jgi:hypothetical protein
MKQQGAPWWVCAAWSTVRDRSAAAVTCEATVFSTSAWSAVRLVSTKDDDSVLGDDPHNCTAGEPMEQGLGPKNWGEQFIALLFNLLI